jgi:hypothetical protein
MKKLHEPLERLAQLFVQKKCWTIADICETFDYAPISIKRFLKQMGYYSSFTHNSKWYTLCSIPEFNKDGIWFYEGIGFSKHGNLTQTILHFIHQSRHGLTSRHLFEKLSVSTNAVLNHMYKAGSLERLKTRKGFFYFSGDAVQKKHQMSRLQMLLAEEKKPKVLSAQAAVYVLTEFIKQPQASFAELSRAVAKKQVLATPEMIAQLFAEHDIKKTLP